jgi:ectoine hydroxylase-related dioxygenase (phytanoyl-CoA dioxygenase family)
VGRLFDYFHFLRRKSSFAGSADHLNEQRVSGWVRDSSRPERRLTVSIALRGEVIGTTEAALPRPDLVAAGIGDGRYGFDFRFGRVLSPAEVDAISISVDGAPIPFLRGAKRSLPAVTAGDRGPYRSRFGGLWTDREDARDILADKHRDRTVTDQEAEQLSKWIEDGYVVLRSAIDPRLTEAVLRDVERAYNGELGLLFREIFANGGIALVPVSERYGGETDVRNCKLIDLYLRSKAALDTVLHETTTRFLNLIFEKPALVFQSLYLEYGSQQPGHQDSAFVPLTAPMQLAASWTALEDIRPGSGELFIYPRSHTIPEFLFEGRYKNQPTASSEARLYTDHLVNEVAVFKFMASIGDVLIWGADTIHGGSAITTPGATRRSLVAHYCPIDVRPQYFDEGCTVRKFREDCAYTFAERGY